MSQTAPEKTTADRNEGETEADPEPESEPEIEEDIVSEELRIDGICGVY